MSRVFVFLIWINCDNGHLEYAYFLEINACNGGSVHAVLQGRPFRAGRFAIDYRAAFGGSPLKAAASRSIFCWAIE